MKVFRAVRKGPTSYDAVKDMIVVAASEMEAKLIVAEAELYGSKPSDFRFEEVDLSTPGIICKHVKYG